MSLASDGKKRATILLTVSCISIAVIMAVLFVYERTGTSSSIPQTHEQPAGTLPASVDDPFDDISLQARAAYVFDINRDAVLFSKASEAQLPLASLTKLMTAVVASEELGGDDTVNIIAADISADGDSGLQMGESWRVRDLLGFTLIMSSNDGALALARAAGARENTSLEVVDPVKRFVALMNQKASDIGLAQTYFLNPTGLDWNPYTSGGYGSARDMTHLMDYALRHGALELETTRNPEITFTSADALPHQAVNTNEIAGAIPGLMAGKTGLTDLAGGNLVIVFDAGVNHPIIIAVLGSTAEGRFEDVEQLVTRSLAALALQNGGDPIQ